MYTCVIILTTCVQIVKRDRKSYIINISKEYSIVSQFTSFVAIEEREKVCIESISTTLYHWSVVLLTLSWKMRRKIQSNLISLLDLDTKDIYISCITPYTWFI